MKTMVRLQMIFVLLMAGCDGDDPGIPLDTSTEGDAVTDTVGDAALDTSPDGTEATPEQLCDELIVVTCDRAFECYLPEHIAALGWTTTGDCEADSHERVDCASAGTCPAGETYSNVMAAQCVEDMRVQSCGDLIGGNMPLSCQQTCH